MGISLDRWQPGAGRSLRSLGFRFRSGPVFPRVCSFSSPGCSLGRSGGAVFSPSPPLATPPFSPFSRCRPVLHGLLQRPGAGLEVALHPGRFCRPTLVAFKVGDLTKQGGGMGQKHTAAGPPQLPPRLATRPPSRGFFFFLFAFSQPRPQSRRVSKRQGEAS